MEPMNENGVITDGSMETGRIESLTDTFVSELVLASRLARRKSLHFTANSVPVFERWCSSVDV